jgi:DNA-directed RNA polymerase specialized sigma24 family protein
MYDPKAPSSVLALTELSKPGVAPRVHRIAWRRCRSDHDAEDLVSDSMMRVCDPDDQPWVPTARPFLRHMSVVIRYLWRWHRARLRTRNEIYDGGTAQEESAGHETSPDGEVDELRSLEIQRRLARRLKTRLADDPEALKLLALAEKEDLEPSEQAEELRWKVDKVHLVAKRIRYQAKAVRHEWLDSEERRMNATRRGADTTGEGSSP